MFFFFLLRIYYGRPLVVAVVFGMGPAAEVGLPAFQSGCAMCMLNMAAVPPTGGCSHCRMAGMAWVGKTWLGGGSGQVLPSHASALSPYCYSFSSLLSIFSHHHPNLSLFSVSSCREKRRKNMAVFARAYEKVMAAAWRGRMETGNWTMFCC